MKIVLVTHGTLPVPPLAWGAVENLAWMTTQHLRRLGHDVRVVNTRNRETIVAECNAFQPDVVHMHYEEYVSLFPRITAKLKIATPNNSLTAFHGRQLELFVNGDFVIAASSHAAANVYAAAGVPAKRLTVVPNGTDWRAFHYNPVCRLPGRSIYLAQITANKRQHVYQDLPGIDFVGGIAHRQFRPGENYLGEWSRARIHEQLTDYANLVLLSRQEMHPCVTGEALVCGLGLVVSPAAAVNLDTSQPFISLVPEERWDDLPYVASVIQANREAAVGRRDEIRNYGLTTCSHDRQVATLLATYARFLRPRRPLPNFQF